MTKVLVKTTCTLKQIHTFGTSRSSFLYKLKSRTTKTCTSDFLRYQICTNNLTNIFKPLKIRYIYTVLMWQFCWGWLKTYYLVKDIFLFSGRRKSNLSLEDESSNKPLALHEQPVKKIL